MCGIIGYLGYREAMPILLEGMEKLAYRGYDSAGVALATESGLFIERAAGKIDALKEKLAGKKVDAGLGIGHTRWATHGRPNEENAHPHSSGSFVVVHNGIIENYMQLRRRLEQEGRVFNSETDTEVIVHLIDHHYSGDFPDAVRAALGELQGSYGIGVISSEHPDMLIAAREQSPMVLGIGEKEFFIASDIPAFLRETRRVVILEDGQMAVITPGALEVRGRDGKKVEAKPVMVTWDALTAEKGGYKHFMLKEIFEQAHGVLDTFRGRIDLEGPGVHLNEVPLDKFEISAFRRIVIVACGTSYYAGMVAEYFLEDIVGLPVELEIASEFRYRPLVLDDETLVITISQSGETADTLAAARLARRQGSRVLAVCNVIGSSLTRECDGVIYTHAGPEIGVASTKAFTAQITALYLLALYMGSEKGSLSPGEMSVCLQALVALPGQIEEVLKTSSDIEKIARKYYAKENFLYLGRGISFPVAMEGALKLKEISYIHAEGYAGGEMKHGPIALIDEDMPVVAIVPADDTIEKMISNTREVRARDGIVIGLTNAGNDDLSELSRELIRIPASHWHLNPILMVIPLQLLAYHIASRRGNDVDQPRNLAKSVTVE